MKDDEIYSEGEHEVRLEEEKITMLCLLKKSTIVILKKLKFKNTSSRSKTRKTLPPKK